jgi:hypothetical protein
MGLFTIEEENLICIFNTGRRASLIDELSNVIPYLDEPETQELAGNTIEKLKAMTDSEFEKQEFIPAYDDDETEELNV